MKTPREILFTRHHTAASKLDAIRRKIVMEVNQQETKQRSFPGLLVASLLGCSNKLCQELIWPCRRVWSGLAVVWFLIIAINVAQHEPSSGAKVSSAPAMMSVREQQRILNELFADRSLSPDAEPPKTFSPKPRTETSQFFFA
jgi:hypothetical protein